VIYIGPMGEFSGLRALITGGASGIGAAVADAIAARGGDVVGLVRGEVAAAVCYLAGPAAGATTGTAPAVDGGMQGLRIPAR
jgi:NAD(P)-dependent dehydrogenase (short-subunit alcohol dehydrogenase family)